MNNIIFKYIIGLVILICINIAFATSSCNIIYKENIKKLPVTKIQDFIDLHIFQAGDSPGLMIGVVLDNEKAVFSCGTIDKDKKIPPNMQTIWPVGSVSKVMTSMIFANMINNGDVKLNDNINTLLNINQDNNIKLIDLATHSSGFPRQLPIMPDVDDYQVNYPYDINKFKLWYKTAKFKNLPGTHYQYSNVGYGLLGQILGNIKNTSYENLVKNTFTTDLKMVDTTVTLTNSQKQRKVQSYWLNGDKIKKDWVFHFEQPSGGIYSTMQDMLIFLDYQLGNINKNKSIANNNITHAAYISQNSFDNPLSFGKDAMALGWEIDYPAVGLPQILMKNGWVNGVNCFVELAPSKNIALISFTNKPNMNIYTDLNKIIGMIISK